MIENSNYIKIKDEISKLINDGKKIMKVLNLLGNSSKDYSKNHYFFTLKYQEWYTKSLPVIRHLLPDRLEEFKRLYHIEGGSNIDNSTYTIEDYLQGVIFEDYSRQYVAKITLYKLKNQVFIVNSVFSRLNSLLANIDELIHADIFTGFLEMGYYLLEEGYKDPAAVLAGGTLEEHLRKLCQKNNIEIKKDDSRYKSADRLNSELANVNVYTKLDQKSITAWLDLRNKAAHGKYDDYTKGQVELMLQGIRDFISRCTA